MESMENDNFHNTYSMKGTNNYSHFTSEKLEKIVEEITGNKSLKNPKYRIKMINEFQKYYLSQLPEIPLMNEYSYFALNKRVKGYKGKTDDPKYGVHLWELTANDPIKAKN